MPEKLKVEVSILHMRNGRICVMGGHDPSGKVLAELAETLGEARSSPEVFAVETRHILVEPQAIVPAEEVA